jgi:hypothetical protein
LRKSGTSPEVVFDMARDKGEGDDGREFRSGGGIVIATTEGSRSLKPRNHLSIPAAWLSCPKRLRQKQSRSWPKLPTSRFSVRSSAVKCGRSRVIVFRVAGDTELISSPQPQNAA